MNATLKTTTKPAKTKPAAKAKTEVKAKPAAKQETKPAKPVFSLVAGAAVIVTHKFLKGAVAYHTAKGSLKKTDKGHILTEQGKALWDKERTAKDPAKFAEIAAWMHGKGECPSEFKGQPATEAGAGVKFPNILYWGSFTTGAMRLAFASIWAK